MLIFPSNGKKKKRERERERNSPLTGGKKKIVVPEKAVKHFHSCLTQFRVLYQKIP